MEDLFGCVCGVARAKLRDDPSGFDIDFQLRPGALCKVAPVQPLQLGMVGWEEGARFGHGVAQQHRDRIALRRRIGPERVAVQMLHVEHRPHIEPAAHHRVSRRKRCDHRLGGGARRIAAELVEEGLRALAGVERAAGGNLLAAHGDGLVEQALRLWHGHQRRNLGPAAGLAEDRDIARIAAEFGHVCLDPFERKDQVKLTCIAAAGEAIGQVEIAEDIEPVIDSDYDYIATFGEFCAVVKRVSDRAGRIGPAVDIDHDRFGTSRLRVGRPDIEEQAVFALRLVARAMLRAGWAQG